MIKDINALLAGCAVGVVSILVTTVIECLPYWARVCVVATSIILSLFVGYTVAGGPRDV